VDTIFKFLHSIMFTFILQISKSTKAVVLNSFPHAGADPGFQVRGGALKKIAPSGGRREHFWGISCEKSRFYTKKSYLFQLRREARNIFGVFRVFISTRCETGKKNSSKLVYINFIFSIMYIYRLCVRYKIA
jgi:hypothetical protein